MHPIRPLIPISHCPFHPTTLSLSTPPCTMSFLSLTHHAHCCSCSITELTFPHHSTIFCTILSSSACLISCHVWGVPCMHGYPSYAILSSMPHPSNPTPSSLFLIHSLPPIACSATFIDHQRSDVEKYWWRHASSSIGRHWELDILPW